MKQYYMKWLLFTANIAIVLLVSWGGIAYAAHSEQNNMQPAIFLIRDSGLDAFREIRSVLLRNGACRLHSFPGKFIFARLPSGFDESVLRNLPVTKITSLMTVEPGYLDPVLHHLINNLLHEEDVVLDSKQSHGRQINDLLLEVPEEILASNALRGQRIGAPHEIMERGMDQNSEFMIGTIVVNVIFPESEGGSEDWTDEELADAASGVVLSLSQYQEHSLWIDPLSVEFIVNLYSRIPVSIEPIEGDRDSDPVWMADVMEYLGYSHSMWDVHDLNNDTRYEHEADWVFTAFVVDASTNGCWQGPKGSYYAYGYLGGPLMVIPFPTCGWSDIVGFMHIFAHEAGHIFWALDEYSSAAFTCDDESGYLRVPTRNTRYQPCEDPLQDCVMNNAVLEMPLSICSYTLGQIGLFDENENYIPDIYEIQPEWEFVAMQDVSSDTIDGDEYLVRAVVTNGAIPNINPYQDPADRTDYTPWLISGRYRIGNGPEQELMPSDGVWDESSEDVEFIASGFAAGDNTLYLEAENCAGLTAQVEKNIYYVGTQLQFFASSLKETYVEISWKLSEYSEDITFYVLRAELPDGGFLDIPHPQILREGLLFKFRDENYEPGITYKYRVDIVEQSERTVLFESRPVDIPALTLTLYQNHPNPFNPSTTIRYYVPRVCAVGIKIYDSSGRLVRNLHTDSHAEAGFHSVAWNGLDERGNEVSSGVFFYRLISGKQIISKKMVLLK